MGGRAAAVPVHLLDSAASHREETTAEDATTEAEGGVCTEVAGIYSGMYTFFPLCSDVIGRPCEGALHGPRAEAAVHFKCPI